jgi:hypothetical protein
MRIRELQPLVQRHFAPSFPDLRLVADLLVTVDDGIMRGFLFNRSQMNKHAVGLYVLAQALFVPTHAVRLGLSRELGDYYIDDPERGGEVVDAMRTRAELEGPSFLARAVDCASLAANATELAGNTVDPAALAETRAYCLVRAGDLASAREELRALAGELGASSIGYHARALERVRTVADALERSPQEARDVLAGWECETARALGLEVA